MPYLFKKDLKVSDTALGFLTGFAFAIFYTIAGLPLAQLADLTGDAPLLDRVKAFYDNGLNDLRDALGWALEYSRPEANPDFGEVNSTGDIVETGLILMGQGLGAIVGIQSGSWFYDRIGPRALVTVG